MSFMRDFLQSQFDTAGQAVISAPNPDGSPVAANDDTTTASAGGQKDAPDGGTPPLEIALAWLDNPPVQPTIAHNNETLSVRWQAANLSRSPSPAFTYEVQVIYAGPDEYGTGSCNPQGSGTTYEVDEDPIPANQTGPERSQSFGPLATGSYQVNIVVKDSNRVAPLSDCIYVRDAVGSGGGGDSGGGDSGGGDDPGNGDDPGGGNDPQDANAAGSGGDADSN